MVLYGNKLFNNKRGVVIHMKITCIGHSGFLLELNSCNLIFDYFKDTCGVITPEVLGKKTFVFVSHAHADHYSRKIFNFSEHGNVTYILESDCPIPKSAPQGIIKMSEGEEITLESGLVKVRAYGSTDIGVSFLVETEGFHIFHAGDLNCWYWEDESTPEELEDDEKRYLNIINGIAGQKIDIAFIPEDPRLGKHSGRGIKQFQEIVAPAKIIPMHFPGNEGKVYK